MNVIFNTLKGEDSDELWKSSVLYLRSNIFKMAIDDTKNDTVENYLVTIVSHLGTLLTQPEEEIVSFGNRDWDLYYVSKGDCMVKLVNY